MARKSIPLNTQRQLWTQCGGYCQNPSCNKYLFLDIEGDFISIANAAHIIGAGDTGPRSEHELADFIDKNDISNLIMLCLDCHKTIDEIEDKYSVEEIRKWKEQHSKKIQALFKIPICSEEEYLKMSLIDDNRVRVF